MLGNIYVIQEDGNIVSILAEDAHSLKYTMVDICLRFAELIPKAFSGSSQ